ncbi:MAG TPA: hypothetical protein VJ884_02655 [Salinibacter sp.]|nr:hypothetical protein [Salinibacter sp.]
MTSLLSTRTILVPLLIIGLAILPGCDSNDDGASIDGDVKVRVDGPDGTSVGLGIEYHESDGIEGTAERLSLDGSEITEDLEDGHAGYRVTASPNPTTASLTLELLNDGNVVKTDDDGEREGGIVTFEVQAGDIQEIPNSDR